MKKNLRRTLFLGVITMLFFAFCICAEAYSLSSYYKNTSRFQAEKAHIWCRTTHINSNGRCIFSPSKKLGTFRVRCTQDAEEILKSLPETDDAVIYMIICRQKDYIRPIEYFNYSLKHSRDLAAKKKVNTSRYGKAIYHYLEINSRLLYLDISDNPKDNESQYCDITFFAKKAIQKDSRTGNYDYDKSWFSGKTLPELFGLTQKELVSLFGLNRSDALRYLL